MLQLRCDTSCVAVEPLSCHEQLAQYHERPTLVNPKKLGHICKCGAKGRWASPLRQTREGWNCRFQKHPARKVGTRSGQCQPKVCGKPSGINFQQLSQDFPGVLLGNPRTDPGNSHSLLEFSDLHCRTDISSGAHMRHPTRVEGRSKSARQLIDSTVSVRSGGCVIVP